MKEVPPLPDLPGDHPLKAYFLESDRILRLTGALSNTDPESESQKFYNIFNQLHTLETRFQRKENQLFPLLEKSGWNSQTQRMWSFHDTLRAQFRLLREKIAARQLPAIYQDTSFLITNIYRLLDMEESILFPYCLETFTEKDWTLLRTQETDYPPMESPAPEKRYSSDNAEYGNSSSGNSHFEQGYMTPQQANLLFQTIPLDITYVDENDKVVFYNRSTDRVFPRSPGIIGREVKYCHPPKSVGTVLKILESFRNGSKSIAEFWIKIKDRLIYIRYVAVRDAQKNYRGVIEISQDITDIQHIKGEKRLLDWN